MNSPKTNYTPLICGLAALTVIAAAVFAVPAILRNRTASTIEGMMASLDIPAVISADSLAETVQENFVTRFGGIYGIDPEPEETAYFAALLKENPVEFEQGKPLREALQRECERRRIPEAALIRQISGIRDSAEREKIRREWTARGKAAVLESEEFIRVMEPVYDRFYTWWTTRHPEYAGIATGISVTNNHDALMEQLVTALWRETLVNMAQQMQNILENDLRQRGKVLSDAKRKKTFVLFLRLCRERYTEELMRKMADAIVKETELTDDDILHCLLLKNRPISEERLTKIQDIQVRYLTPGMLNEIPDELVIEVRKDLEDITGVNFNMR